LFPSQIFDDDTLTEAHQEGGSAQNLSRWVYGSLDIQHEVPVRHTVHLWIFDVRHREDENLELLTRGLAPGHHAPVYGKAPYYPTDLPTSSTSCGACSGLTTRAGPYYHSVMTSQGHSIRTTIFQPSAGTLSSPSSGAAPNRGSIEDYPKIRAAPTGTLPLRSTASAWWVLPG
jgi:hypothetical protein